MSSVTVFCLIAHGVLPLHGESTVGTPAELKRALKANRSGGTIRLSPGRYELDATISLDRARKLIILGPETGPPAVLTGSSHLPASGWQRVTDAEILGRIIDSSVRPRLVEFSLSKAQARPLGKLTRRGFEAGKFAESPPARLTFNGKVMTLARWPNDSREPVVEVLVTGPNRSDHGDAFYEKGGVFRVDGSRMANWASADEVWIDGILGRDWHWTFNRVKRLNPTRGLVELRHGEVSGIRDEDWLHTEVQFVNLLEEIDASGEYYIDRRRQKIYFLPPPSPGKVPSTGLTRLDAPLLRIRNSHDVTIRGLQFDGGRADGIVIEEGSNITIDGCAIRNVSGEGIRATGEGIHVRRCLFSDIGGIGVRLNGGNLKTLSPSGHFIEDCAFTRNAQVEQIFQPAVALEGVGHSVRGCDFFELPHMAIEMTGNDFTIEKCTFTRTSLRFRDMGAIYVNTGDQPEMRGHVIRHNLFHDLAQGGRSTGAIYLDNGSCGFAIEENAFLRVGDHEDSWGVMLHGGGEVHITRNLFVDCARPVHLAYWWNSFGKNDYPEQLRAWSSRLPRLPAHARAYPELRSLLRSDRQLPDTNSFTENLTVNESHLLAHGTIATTYAGPLEKLKQSGNVFLTSNPGFEDIEAGNLSLPADSTLREQLPFLQELKLPRPRE
ncbi:MAG: right-handed parallel beta-helix repeat-containing protein [Verrucomicrobiota bacterium]